MADDGSSTRRDIVVTAALVMTAGAVVTAVWPLVSQMAPNSATPVPESAAVKLGGIPPGAEVVVAVRRRPFIVRHRTVAEIAAAERVDVGSLRDRRARTARLPVDAPALDENRVRAGMPQWLVLSGACTQEACVVRGIDAADRLADGIGWVCPCCASRYDLSGRVVAGPAPTNLAVPSFAIASQTLRIE